MPTLNTNQRYLTGLAVYDTYNGLNGTIYQMNLDTGGTSILSPPYVGPYFVVQFTDGSLQMFTLLGRRIKPDGYILAGTTLLTSSEKTAAVGAGYPATS